VKYGQVQPVGKVGIGLELREATQQVFEVGIQTAANPIASEYPTKAESLPHIILHSSGSHRGEWNTRIGGILVP